MKRFFKRLGLFLLVISGGFLLGLTLSVLFAPSLLINQWTVSQGLRLTDRYIVPISWQELAVDASSPDFFVKALALTLKGVCLEQADTTVCGKEISLAAHVDLRPGRWRLPHLGPIRLIGLSVQLQLAEAEESEAEPSALAEPLRPLVWLERLEEMTIDPVIVEMDQFIVVQGDRKLLEMSGRLDFSGLHRHRLQEGERSTDRLQLAAKGRIQDQSFQVDGQIDLKNYRSIFDQGATIDSQFKGKFANHRGELQLTLDPQVDPKVRQTKLQIQYRTDETNLRLLSRGRLTDRRFNGQIEATATEILDNLVDFELRPCGVSAAWGARLTDDLSLELKCQGTTTRKQTTAHESIVGKFLPESIDFTLDVDGNYQHADAGDAYQVSSKLRVRRAKNSGLRLVGLVNADISKSQDQVQPALDIKLDVEAAIDEFSELVQQLADTELAIPSPLNQLRGDTVCRIRGRYVSYDERDQFPLNCQVNLGSERQGLQAELNGQLVLMTTPQGLQPHLDADVTLRSLEIALPDFQIGQQVPKMVPDKRFVMEDPPRKAEQAFANAPEAPQAEPANEVAFSYHVRMSSESSDTIRIHSNLLRVPLPLAANIELHSDYGMEGRVSIADYSVSMFRRQALVQNVVLEIHRDRVDHPISGRVLFDTADYTIQLNILGTAESPTLVLESTPPLPEKDLYAILLFGSPPEGLSTDRVRSVDETRAAIADGAIGLLSMYYLASTPIESIGYNPNDGMFTARVALQEGLTLTVGTDVERAGEVGLRKRIGQNWSIETRALRGEEGEAGRAVAMLRWGLRY